MKRGKFALVIPTDVSEKGVQQVARKLKAAEVNVLTESDCALIVEWDRAARSAVEDAASIRNYFTDKISPRQINELPADVERAALIWNWGIASHGKRVSERSMRTFLDKIGFEFRDEKIYDDEVLKDN